MCKKKQFKYCPSEIDECMRFIIRTLKSYKVPVKACCCGHKKYPMTIIVEQKYGGGNITHFDIISGKIIPRKRNFYKKNSDGYYYIPETLEK